MLRYRVEPKTRAEYRRITAILISKGFVRTSNFTGSTFYEHSGIKKVMIQITKFFN